MSWAPAIDYLIVRCRQLLPSIILQKVLEFADVLPNSRIVSCDGLMNNVCGSKRLECPTPASVVPLDQLAHLRPLSMRRDKLPREGFRHHISSPLFGPLSASVAQLQHWYCAAISQMSRADIDMHAAMPLSAVHHQNCKCLEQKQSTAILY